MSTKIKTITIKTERISTFAPDVQKAFAAVSQHIDWLFRRTGGQFQHEPLPGSGSWLPFGGAEAKVVVKALPWDSRMRSVMGQYSKADGGVIVLLRDQYLTKAGMRVLWEEYGQAYRPCPPEPVYNVPLHKDKAFQMILLTMGDGCDLLKLPGVDQSRFGDILQEHAMQGREATPANHPSGHGTVDRDDDSNSEIKIDMERIAAALSDVLERAKADSVVSGHV